MNYPRILPVGDQALTVEFGNIIDESINRQVHSLSQKIEAFPIPGVRELLPTYRSLLICYDPDQTDYFTIVKTLKSCHLNKELTSSSTKKKKIWDIPCCYEEPFSPDLEDMTRLTGLSREEIIRIHSSVDYPIYMLGFLPGFVYLGGLDERIHCPRLDTPRTRIPAGSVGIGGSQTGIYPLDSPGGWRLIGKTPIKLYDPEKKEPILCKAGDYIHFHPISTEEYQKLL